ncbi:MAG: polysaccharide lyase 6 family protein [Xanthomonadales bacterium]|nr:polysaccharide lyase 6 family protein [Xanthomonadales bacterium]
MRWIQKTTIRRAFLVLIAIATTPAVLAGVVVSDQSEYQEAVKDAQPGDVIQLANGIWKDFEIVFTGNGTEDAPITLTAEEKGEVIITGQSNLKLAGEYLVVSGLVFKNGFTPTSEVISFRSNKEHLANHSRVTEVVIDSFNNPERTETDYWVSIYGKHNRFDHNHLAGKSNNGVTLAVRLDTETSQQNYHRIDHNYFGHRPILGSNGGETMRIGTSHYSLTDSFTTVENNYFERCDGEVEIISNKSGGNVFRGNVFFESRGTLTLRHGNGNLVENNVFFGNGADHTGGIRLINKRQVIRNNYLQSLTGTRFGSPLTVMNGVPDSPINRYHQVEDSVIENNTLIDVAHIELAAGSDDERSAVPKTTRFANNLIYNRDGKDIFTVHDDISGIDFENNVLNEVADFKIERGFTSRKVRLKQLPNGLMAPVNEDLDGIGASHDLKVLSRDETGVAWYPKPDGKARFDSGSTHVIGADGEALVKAVAAAQAGDVIELAPGHYQVEKLIHVNKPLTIRSSSETRPTIEFERTALFEIEQGGALKLQGLVMDGSSAPDTAGNAVVRTSRYSMLGSYDLLLDDCVVRDLDVNHSFNFLTVAKSTFADHISIRDSVFSDVTGAVLQLDKETDDLGLYNVEYVDITGSTFTDIGKTLLSAYRGGTDESTFGPHVNISNNELNSVGNNKRNKTGASVYMLGVQLADIFNNEFVDSKPVRAMLTVGDPVTTIIGNSFKNTPAPEILNGQAILRDNTVNQ